MFMYNCSSIMYIIFRVLLNILHILYYLYSCIQQSCSQLVSTLKQLKYSYKLNFDYSLRSLDVNKIPKHLAVLIGQEKISTVDIAKITNWCIHAKIPYLSFYDHKGIFQNDQIFFEKKIVEFEPIIGKNIEWLSLSDEIVLDCTTKDFTKLSNDKEICSSPPVKYCNIAEVNNKHKTKVQMLSFKDGKDKVIALTKNLASIINLNIIDENDITPEFLNEKLSTNETIPDPDLALVFGTTLCTYGFLPWHSRVTEFINIPTHHNLSSDHFIDILIKFSKCQQRYGK